jgi:environmental stress-induced protein Ves
VRIIDPSAWRAQPWKNGAGTTHEIVREPDDDNWRVRVSVADVSAPAPFSAFPGVSRWLYLLAGGPVVIDRGGARVELRAAGDGFAFDGAEQVAAIEVARPSRDLNFMVRGDGGAAEIVRGPGATRLIGCVFAIAGAISIDGVALGAHACAWEVRDREVVLGDAGSIAAILRI